MSDYIVYIHTFPNRKKYVGITSQEINRRWRNGKGYEGQPVYEAIKKYGWNNIKHEILFTNLTKEEAETKEKELIKEFGTKSHENGYNIENGGNATKQLSEETKNKISKAKVGKYAGDKHWNYGNHWSKETKNKIREARMKNNNGKNIICIETGIIYQSGAEAQRQTGINSSSIRKCCKKKCSYNTAGGYHWSYANGGDLV